MNRMDEILHESWDKVMRKYADSPEPDPDVFVQKYRSFIESNTDMDATPLTGARLRKRFRKMGVPTATGLDGWCVADLLCLPNALFDMLAQLLMHIESTGLWPRVLARGFVSLIPKGEGMLPMQQRPLSVLSRLYRVWTGVGLEECMIWQEKWVHPHAYGFRKKRGATDAAALIALLIELHIVVRAALKGFGLDYVKCFDLIPQQVVLRVALEQGMHIGTHRALSGMYTQLTRCFKIMGCLCSFFAVTNGILQGCPLSVILTNLMTSIWKKILDAQSQAMRVSSARLPPGGKPGEVLDFIPTALGYADDTYGMAAGQHTVQPLVECTHEWLQTTGQDVNPKKSVSFVIPDSDQEIQMRGVSFPKETEFRSLGAGVRTTDSVASGPLILKRTGKASALLDRIHGM